MKTNLSKIYTMLLAIMIGSSSITAVAQNPTARVQVIHNSADMAAETVDVWLNNTLLIDDFKFRTASPFIDAPAGQEFNISIKGPDSDVNSPALWSREYNLEKGQTYVLIANGIVSPIGYEPVQPFDIYVYALGREMANEMGNTDLLVFHGSTDAPIVDIAETEVVNTTVVNDLMYGDFAGYLELPTDNYVLDVRDQSGENSIVKYSAPLRALGLQGQAIVAVASGFLNPDKNSGGEAFGLWVALPSGGNLVELPLVYTPTARVQVIHNSADAAAEMVDVWLDNELLIDNFTFRTATPFVDVPAGQEFTLTIKDANSQNALNPIWSRTYSLEEGKTYVLIASGIVSPDGYTPTRPFDIYAYDMGRETSSMPSNTDVLVFHGATDAPTIDIVPEGSESQVLVDNLSYGEFEGYLELPTSDYILEIKDESSQNTVVAYNAPLASLGLQNQAIVTVASGFLDTSRNNEGSAFGLWVALPTGGQMIELPLHPQVMGTARVQVIHNSADAAAEMVDVWLDNTLLLDDFTFRTASPFIDAPAGEAFTISIKGSDSQNPDNPIWSQSYTLEENQTYVLIANGIVSPDGYNPAQPFDIYVYAMGREQASMMGQTDLLVFHGSTDAPTVDIVETGVGAGTVIDNLMYGDFNGYLELPTANYQLTIKDESGMSTVAVYEAPLADLLLENTALTIVASGFLAPENNQNGPAFGLWVALPNGGELVPLSVITSTTETFLDAESFNAYPNPTSDILNIDLTLAYDADVTIDIFNLTGSVVKSADMGRVTKSTTSTSINVNDLNTGLYFVRVAAGNQVVTKKIQVAN